MLHLITQNLDLFWFVLNLFCAFLFEQITQDDIRKTYGGSSGSRGYYSSAFARLVLADRFGLGSIRTMVFSFWSFFFCLYTFYKYG